MDHQGAVQGVGSIFCQGHMKIRVQEHLGRVGLSMNLESGESQ